MANLKDLRNRIKSVKSIQQVTKAMKMVAAAKMRRAQENMEHARPYSSRILDLIQSLLPDIDRTLLPELEIRSEKRCLFVVITADRGMAGAFNTNILKRAQVDIDSDGRDKAKVICIGKKSRDYFNNRNFDVVSEHFDFWNDLNFENAIGIGQEIVDLFLTKEVDKVRVYYNEFKNLATQIIKGVDFLPLEYSSLDEDKKQYERLFEPSKEEILTNLIPRHINVQVWQFLLESYASEQAARMLAMENATENAGEMIKELGLQYNKARQSAITTEIIEIVSGANALSS